MIEDYFDRPHAIRARRAACTGPHIDEFAATLTAQGYSRNAGRALLRGVACIGLWLDGRGVDLSELDETLIERFVREQMSRPGGGRSSSLERQFWASGRRLLGWARERGLVLTSGRLKPLPGLLMDFETWMRSQRGCSEKTLRNCYRLPLRRFLEAAGEDLRQVSVQEIRKFILAESKRAGRGYCKTATTAVRMLLRYLAIHGRCSPELVDAVPTLAHWKLASLPAFLPGEAIDRIIGTADPATTAGRRDRAMLLLMARLALRAGDVADLHLDDIDWHGATLLVSGKSKRQVRMPLCQEVGDAVLLWLSNGRPDLDDSHVFLRLRAPSGPLNRTGVTSALLRAARRADVALPRAGSHVLRHSVATALLNDGMTLPGVGALLRHQSLDTTMIYAKVDTALLVSVARPWPREVPR